MSCFNHRVVIVVAWLIFVSEANCIKEAGSRGVGEGGAGGAVAPPVLKAGGLSPPSFSTSLCVVVIV